MSLYAVTKCKVKVSCRLHEWLQAEMVAKLQHLLGNLLIGVNVLDFQDDVFSTPEKKTEMKSRKHVELCNLATRRSIAAAGGSRPVQGQNSSRYNENSNQRGNTYTDRLRDEVYQFES